MGTFSHKQVIEWVCSEMGVDPKTIQFDITRDTDRIKPWIGISWWESRTIQIWLNGKPRSKKKRYGIRIRTWNHYETLLVAIAHEVQHLETPTNEKQIWKAERRILRRHRRNIVCFIWAFFQKPEDEDDDNS